MTLATPIVLAPQTQPLTIYAGNDIRFDVTVKNNDGTAFNLTSAAPQAQIRATWSDPTPLASFEIVLDATPGLMHLHLSSAVTAALPFNAVWDLQITTPDVLTLLNGTVRCSQEVTR